MIKRTPLFLMANLGSEVSKIISAKQKKDYTMLNFAVLKANSIITELKEIPETRDNAEIDILEKVINDLTSETPMYNVSILHLKSYFLPFSTRLMQI